MRTGIAVVLVALLALVVIAIPMAVGNGDWYNGLRQMGVSVSPASANGNQQIEPIIQAPTSTGIPQTQPLGDVSDWRGAGSDAGCPGYPELTSEFVQNEFNVGIGVFRLSNYECVWGANGAQQTLAFDNDNDLGAEFEVYDVASGTVYRNPGSLTLSNFLIVHLGSHAQFDYDAYLAAQQASCERLPEINAQILSEMISATMPSEDYQPIHLAKNEGEDCGFYVRHGRFATQIPNPEVIGYVLEFTIHPSGDDDQHSGGVDDEVFVTYNDIVTDMTLDVYSMTVRVVRRVEDGRLGFSPLDAVNNRCELWWHEFANGLIERPIFGVYPLGFQCEYDREFVQGVLEDRGRSDVTAPEEPTLYGVSFEDAIIDRSGMQEGESNTDSSFRD